MRRVHDDGCIQVKESTQGDSIPDGSFHGGDAVPIGTFHGSDSVPPGTFHCGLTEDWIRSQYGDSVPPSKLR
jgi:hypothetical protein